MLAQWKYNNKGFSIIEILVATGIIGIALVSFMGLFNSYLKTSQNNEKNVQALNFAQEAIEAVRAVRDESWDNISNLTMAAIYHPVQQGTPKKWTLTLGTETIDNFYREIIFENGLRDENYNIVASGGTVDSDTKKVEVSVCWGNGINCVQTPHKVRIVTYITNWKP